MPAATPGPTLFSRACLILRRLYELLRRTAQSYSGAQNCIFRHLGKHRVARMMGALIWGIGGCVITADESPPWLLAGIQGRGMQQIGMEEKAGARRHFAVDMLQTLFGSIHALRVGARLAAETAMLNSSHPMGTPEHFETAIRPRRRINGDQATCHIRKQAAILIPVSIVLMPFPGPTHTRFLEDHLRVVVVNLPTEKGLHSIDNARQPGYEPKGIVAGVVPPGETNPRATGICELEGTAQHFVVGESWCDQN